VADDYPPLRVDDRPEMASTIRRAAAAISSLTTRNRKPRYESLNTAHDDEEDPVTLSGTVRKATGPRNRQHDMILLAVAILGLFAISYAVIA
jgi:hypothetical protein